MLADSFHVVGLYCMKNLSYSEARKALPCHLQLTKGKPLICVDFTVVGNTELQVSRFTFPT